MNTTKNFNNDEEEILCFDDDNNNHKKDLTNFDWDNFGLYVNRQEKLAKKLNSSACGDIKNLGFYSIFTNIIKDQILKKVDFDKMKKAFGIFMITLMLQLILSRK